MFVRLAAIGHEPILLRTQYRCHPLLSKVPSELFYNGRLKDGVTEQQRPALVQGLPPLLFCDTGQLGREGHGGHRSIHNRYEAELTCRVLHLLLALGVSPHRIGVIALYRSQAALVEQLMQAAAPSPQKHEAAPQPSGDLESARDRGGLQVSTVDAFQGMEKDIIVLSCCRTEALGFVASPERLNVALTRARHHLIILGKASILHQNHLWGVLLERVRSTPGCYMSSTALVQLLRGAVGQQEASIIESDARVAGVGGSLLREDSAACSQKVGLPEDKEVPPQRGGHGAETCDPSSSSPTAAARDQAEENGAQAEAQAVLEEDVPSSQLTLQEGGPVEGRGSFNTLSAGRMTETLKGASIESTSAGTKAPWGAGPGELGGVQELAEGRGTSSRPPMEPEKQYGAGDLQLGPHPLLAGGLAAERGGVSTGTCSQAMLEVGPMGLAQVHTDPASEGQQPCSSSGVETGVKTGMSIFSFDLGFED